MGQVCSARIFQYLTSDSLLKRYAFTSTPGGFLGSYFVPVAMGDSEYKEYQTRSRFSRPFYHSEGSTHM